MPINAADVRCPKCNGPVWDERPTKKNPKGPDFKCKDVNCKDERGLKTGIWERDLMKTQAPAATAPAATPTTNLERLNAICNASTFFLDHVLEIELPKLERSQIGASDTYVHARVATLLITAEKGGAFR